MRAGLFIFEFRNLRLGRAVHFFKKVSLKLPMRTSTRFKYNQYLNLEATKSTNVRFNTF